MPKYSPHADRLWGQEWYQKGDHWISSPTGIHLWEEDYQQGWQCSHHGQTGCGQSAYDALQNLLGDPLTVQVGESNLSFLYPQTCRQESGQTREYSSCAARPWGTVAKTPEGWWLEASDRPYPSPEDAWAALVQDRHFWGLEWDTDGQGWNFGFLSVHKDPAGWYLHSYGSGIKIDGRFPTREEALEAYFGTPKQVHQTTWYPWIDGTWVSDTTAHSITHQSSMWFNDWLDAVQHSTLEAAVQELARHEEANASYNIRFALSEALRAREFSRKVGG